MSFQKRFLNLGLVIAAAKTVEGFSEFEGFMTRTYNNTYIDKESFAISELFRKFPGMRKNLWIILGTQKSSNVGSSAIRALTKAWLIVDHHKNELRHQEVIDHYLELVKECDPEYRVLLIEIVNELKK